MMRTNGDSTNLRKLRASLQKAVTLINEYPQRLAVVVERYDECGFRDNLRDLQRAVPRSNPANAGLSRAVRGHDTRFDQAVRASGRLHEPMFGESRTPAKLLVELEFLAAVPVVDLSADDLRALSADVSRIRSGIGVPDPTVVAAPDLRDALSAFTREVAGLGGSASPRGQLGSPGNATFKVAQRAIALCSPENPLGEYRSAAGPRQDGLELVVAYAEFAAILERDAGIVIPGGHEIQQLAQQAQAYRAAQMHNEIVAQQQQLLTALDGLDQKIELGLAQHQQRTTEILYGDRSTPNDTIGREPPTAER